MGLEYVPTFTIGQKKHMQVNIPYMEHLGFKTPLIGDPVGIVEGAQVLGEVENSFQIIFGLQLSTFQPSKTRPFHSKINSRFIWVPGIYLYTLRIIAGFWDLQF